MGDVKYYTIVGKCGYSVSSNKYWDNLVRVESVKIDGAKENYIVSYDNLNNYGAGKMFHNAMLNPNEVPEVYDKVVEFLIE